MFIHFCGNMVLNQIRNIMKFSIKCFLKIQSLLFYWKECSSNCDITYEKIYHFWNYEYHQFDIVMFGKTLFSGLEAAYASSSLQVKEFGEKCYALWNCLPEQIGQIEPFFRLCYADDCLSYGDEKQTRVLRKYLSWLRWVCRREIKFP